MKALDFLTASPVFLELGQSFLKVINGDNGLELMLERQQNGRLTESCKERVISTLQTFLQQRSWGQRRRAFCAIGSRGVTLRRLSLPASSKDDLPRLLTLQIEAEFPLPPDQLAWGYRPIDEQSPSTSQTAASQEFIVVAVKREVVEDYSELLTRCGLNPVFTLAALTRNSLCQGPPRNYSILDIERNHSELTVFENTAPTAIRILPWGSETLTRSIQEQLAITPDEAEKLKVQLDQQAGLDAELAQKLQRTVRTELDVLAGLINSHSIGQKIYLSGQKAGFASRAMPLAEVLKGGVECETIDVAGEGQSAAILGLKKSFESNGTVGPLNIQLARTKRVQTAPRPEVWKWAVTAGLLALTSLLLRYAEAFIQKPRLTKRMAEFRTYQQGAPAIEKELSFLQYLQTNHAPYIEAALTIANAAAPGTRIDSLSMNRRGELSFRGVLQNPPQVVEFRSKLIDSGFFSTVVLEEQSPSPDRQRVTVRISAQWKPAGARPSVSVASQSSSSKNVKPERPAASKMNLVGATNAPPSKTESSK